MTQPRIGVMGAGYWGAKIVRVCSELGMLESVCEADSGTRERIAAQYPNARVVADARTLLASDVDAVILATPAATHVDLALEAIAAGKHVFVEKPLALHVEDASTVVRAAQAGGRVLFVGHLMLYHPAMLRARELVASGAIGDLHHVRARRVAFGKLRSVENAWWSIAPHDVALTLAFFAADPVAVSGAQHAVVRRDVADFAYADLQFENNRSAHIEVSWLDPHKSAQFDLFGTTGVLRFASANGNERLTLTPCGAAPDARGYPELWREEAQTITFDAIEPLRAELSAFARAIVTGERPLTDGEEGARVVAVLAALDRASSNRHVIPAEALL